tara:strand:+ start:282 stop:461 length:180 start_codon:yes stop_codon:yes gene_type:complete
MEKNNSYPVGFEYCYARTPLEERGFELRRKLEIEDEPQLNKFLKLSDGALGRLVNLLKE